MTDAAAVKAFIYKWEQNTQKESAAAKEHFVELCRLLGQPTPNDPGSGPDSYCFEKSLTKTGGKAGFADVWKKDRFAWEYKGKAKLKQRTLTNLYNKRPDWLDQAHKRLDAAVFDAYGWPHDPSTSSGQALSDDESLARLLALNLERAAGQGEVPVEATEDSGEEEAIQK